MAINVVSYVSIVSHFLLDFLVSFFNPLGPYLIDKFNIEVRLFTTFLTLSSAIASLFQIFFGFWFDKVTFTKKYIVLMYFLEAFGISVLGISTNFLIALLAIFTIRIANSAFHPLGASMAGESGNKTVAIFSIAGTLGASLGPVFISFYVSKFALTSLWIVSVPFVIMAFSMIWLGIPPKSTKHNEKMTFKEVSVLIPILLVVTIRSFLMSVVHAYTPIFVTTIKNYPITISGALITIGMITGVFSNYVGVLLMERIGAKKQDFIAFLGMALSVFTLLISQSLPGLFLSFIFFDFFGFLLMSANVVQAQKILPHRKALASSVAMGFAWSIGDFIASGYNSIFGNNVKLSLALVIPIAVLASIYFGIIQKFDTK